MWARAQIICSACIWVARLEMGPDKAEVGGDWVRGRDEAEARTEIFWNKSMSGIDFCED